tara:strand:- start:23843 stop:24064 length:222 start_codon:yes stop_codon:yes gene_type:complete
MSLNYSLNHLNIVPNSFDRMSIDMPGFWDAHMVASTGFRAWGNLVTTEVVIYRFEKFCIDHFRDAISLSDSSA